MSSIKKINQITRLLLFVLILNILSISSNSFAYVEGEEASNMDESEIEIEQYSIEEACANERGKCLDDVKIRIVEGIAVERDCWKYSFNKNCKGRSKNNCATIQQDDFQFNNEYCIAETTIKAESQDKKACIDVRKVFTRSSSQNQEIKYTKIINDPDNNEVAQELLCDAFCLDGNCKEVFKADQFANDEIVPAIAELEMLSKIKEGMVDPKTLHFNIFGGDAKRCHNKTSVHSDCCKDIGLIKKLGLVKCPAEVVNLSREARKGKCIGLGTYCAKRTLGVCIRKTTTFCCFPTILAKIIRLGARDQLGKSLGSAEHPQCGGLSIEDLEKLDFSKLNFTEFHEKEVQPMMNTYNSADNEKFIKKSFPEAGSINSKKNGQSFGSTNSNGVDEEKIKKSDGEER